MVCGDAFRQHIAAWFLPRVTAFSKGEQTTRTDPAAGLLLTHSKRLAANSIATAALVTSITGLLEVPL